MTEPLNGWRTFVLTIKGAEAKSSLTMGLLGGAGIKAEAFYGLDANITGVNGTKHTYEIDHPGSNYHIGEKHINMHLSYLMLWKVLSYIEGDAFVLLEDDVRLEPDWKAHFDYSISHLPDDWDMLYLGSCCSAGRSDKQEVWGRLHRVRYALCTHAYAVRKKALPLILNRCEKVWAGTDIALALDCMPHLNCYAFLPRLATQLDTNIPP